MGRFIYNITRLMADWRIDTRSLFLTYPQCFLSKERLMEHLRLLLDPESIVVAREDHKDGGSHLHAYIKLKKKKTFKNCRFFDVTEEGGIIYHPNIQSARNPYAVIKYVQKDDDYIQYNIDLAAKFKANQSKTKYINDQILEKGLKGITDQVREGNISFKDVKKYEEGLHRFNQLEQEVPSIMNRLCLWIYGSPGIGKSYWVRSRYPRAFIKAQNKWWDGYSTQQVVLLDDLDSDAMGHMIKIWGDQYSFQAEAKGSSFTPQYQLFIVTSNKLPIDLWKDRDMAEAIMRRFKLCTINGDRELVNSYGEPMDIKKELELLNINI